MKQLAMGQATLQTSLSSTMAEIKSEIVASKGGKEARPRDRLA